MATDLEVGIRISVPGVIVETPGNAVLPIARFGPILRECTDEKLYLESDPQGTLVRGDRSEWKLPGENPDEFPNVTAFKEEKFHELAARLFREIVRRTVFATDNESSRYALGGVLLEMEGDKIIAVGTDGRRLAKMEGPAHGVGGHQTANQTTIVPTRAMNLLERAVTDSDGEIQISARANDILIRSPRFTIYSRLVEGRFPKWRDVFPRRSDVVKTELSVGPLYRGGSPGGDCHQRRKPRHRFHFRRRLVGAVRPGGRCRAIARRTADRVQRAENLHFAGSAVRERFSAGAGSRKNIHPGIERLRQRRGLHDRRRLRLRHHAAGAIDNSEGLPRRHRGHGEAGRNCMQHSNSSSVFSVSGW